jgi:hypothetical protein
MKRFLPATFSVFILTLSMQSALAQSNPTINSVSKKSYNGSDISCTGIADAELTVNASGGTGSLQYSVDGGAHYQSGKVFSGLEGGQTYAIFVKDSKGKVSGGNWTYVSNVNAVRISSVYTVSSYGNNDQVTCFGATDGSFGISANGGTGTILYSVDNGITYQASHTPGDLAAGTYSVKVKDQNGCMASSSYTLHGPDAVTAQITQTNISCAQPTGSIVISPAGGAGSGFNYSLDGGQTIWGSTINGLSAGTHQLLVKDYRGCSATLPVTITASSFTATISGNATTCLGTSGNFVIGIAPGNGTQFTAVYKDQKGKSTTVKNLAAGDNTVSTIAITENMTYTLVSVKSNSGTCTATVSGSASISALQAGQWLGINSNWNDGVNWSCGSMPTLSSDVTIPVTHNNPIISRGTAKAHNITVSKGASLTLEDTLQLAGTISGAGKSDASDGVIEFDGTAIQTISGSQFVNNTLNNLVIHTQAGLNLSAATGDTLNVTGMILFRASHAVLYTNNNLTLKSTASATAGVGDLTNGGQFSDNSISGNVTVERFVNTGALPGQHSKAWVMVSTPTQGQTIKQSWMENGDKTSTGYGVQITGNGTGLDAVSPSPSLKYYDDKTNAWVAVTNTGDPLYNDKGYMLFVRGDRSISGTQTSNTTTLRSTGVLLTGSQPSLSVKAGKFQSVGNPYAADVDIRKISTKGLNPDIIIWDATLTIGSAYGLGAYQTLYKKGSNYVNLLPSAVYGPAGTVNNYIKSGQAFFVQAYQADGTITFTEQAKSSAAGAGIAMRGQGEDPETSLGVHLLGVNADGSTFMADGAFQEFGSDYSTGIDDQDTRKFANSSENLSVRTAGKDLVIERRDLPAVTDTVFYNISGMQNHGYRLEFDAEGLPAGNLQAYLEDSYTKTAVPLNPAGITPVDFTVTADAASRAVNRFRVVFRQMAGTLPVTLVSLTASKVNDQVRVEWKVENQSDMKSYSVERSVDGINFKKVADIQANQMDAATYRWEDQQPADGINYYRIVSVDVSGRETHSPVVSVAAGFTAPSISVYPNPAVNAHVNIQFAGQKPGIYYLALYNPLGQVVVTKTIDHREGNGTETLDWSKASARGIYTLTITTAQAEPQSVKIKY